MADFNSNETNTATKYKGGAVKLNDLTEFTQGMSTMIGTGMPVLESIETVLEQSDPVKQKHLCFALQDIIAQIRDGNSLAEAFSSHPKVFSKLYCAMVKVGEHGGVLDVMLNKLATFLENAQKLRSKIKSAMMYPCMVILFAAVLVSVMVLVIVPKFVAIYADFHAQLPLPTLILINVSDFIRGEWYVVLPSFIAFIVVLRLFFKSNVGHRIWDTWRIKVPIFGPLAHMICLERFTSVFAEMQRSGIPILELLDVVGDTAGNCVIQDAIKVVAADITEGSTLSQALKKHPVFPLMLVRVIATGEKAGKTDEIFDKVAKTWRDRVENKLAALTSIIEPLLIIFIGSVIGAVVAALYLPVFKMSDILFQQH
jgi:type IV pilus assembly protein PilC